MLLATSLVGSYPQPEWLIDRAMLSKQVPRTRAEGLWLVARDKLQVAQDDATVLAIHDQERAGLDIITDGEQRRESYSNRFATALDGIDVDKDVVDAARIDCRQHVFRGGKQHALLHQAGGITDAGDVVTMRFNGEIIKIGAPKDDSDVGGSWYESHVAVNTRVQTHAAGCNFALNGSLEHGRLSKQDNTLSRKV